MMEITKAADINSASNEHELVIDLREDEDGTVHVYDRHLRMGGMLTVLRGNVDANFGHDAAPIVVVNCDAKYDVRVRNARELRVFHGTVTDVYNTPLVEVRDGSVYICDNETRTIDVAHGTAYVSGNVNVLTAGIDAHVRVHDVDYLETAANAWVYAAHVTNARLRGTSFSHLRSVADGFITHRATAKITDSGSIEAMEYSGLHVGGRTYVSANDHSEIVATDNCIVRRNSLEAKAQCFDDALTISYHGYEPASVVKHLGGDAARELSKHAYKATTDMGCSGKRYGRPTKWVVGTTVMATDWEPTVACGHGLHVSRLPGDTLEFLDYHDMLQRPKLFEVEVPDGDDRIRLSYSKDKVPSAYVVREVDVVGRPLHD